MLMKEGEGRRDEVEEEMGEGTWDLDPARPVRRWRRTAPRRWQCTRNTRPRLVTYELFPFHATIGDFLTPIDLDLTTIHSDTRVAKYRFGPNVGADPSVGCIPRVAYAVTKPEKNLGGADQKNRYFFIFF